MKGFKKDGKFRPTEKRNKSALTTESVKFKKPVSFGDDEFKKKKMGATIQEQKVIDILGFDQLNEDAKEKAREWVRDWLGQENFFADYDGLIYDKETELADYDVFSNYGNGADGSNKTWDVSQGGGFIQFPEIQVKDESKLFKMLGLPKSLLNNLDSSFTCISGNCMNLNYSRC